MGRANRNRVELELRTAAWAVSWWADSIQRDEIEGGDFDKLEGKIECLRKTIARGEETRGKSYLPREMVQDEFNELESSAEALHEAIVRAASNASGCELLLSSGHEYCVETWAGKEFTARRPLWLGSNVEEAVEAIRFKSPENKVKRLKSLPPAKLHKRLVSELFDLSAESVKEKVAENSREWASNPLQRYLVAMYMIAVRRSKEEVDDARIILNALKDSGYHPLGIYHLVKRANDSKHMIDVEINWGAVDAACSAVTSPDS
jgi:hypothetical protein